VAEPSRTQFGPEPLSNWRITKRFFFPTLRGHWPVALALVAVSVVLSVVPALKSVLESAVISAIDVSLTGGETFDEAIDTPVDRLTTEGGGIEGFVLGIASTAFDNAVLWETAVSYGVITLLAAFLVWLSTAARAFLERELFTKLRGAGMETLMDPSASALALNEGDEQGVTVQAGAFNIAAGYAGMLQLVQYALALGVTTWLVLSKNWRLAVAILVVVVAQALLTYAKTRRLRKDRHDLEEQRDGVVRRSDDIIDKRDFIAAHEQREYFGQLLRQLAKDYGTIEQRLARRDQAFRSTAGVLADVGRLGILFVALAVASGAVGQRSEVSSIGDAYFLIAIYVRMLNPTQGLLNIWDDYRGQRDISRRFRALLAAGDKLQLQKAPTTEGDGAPGDGTWAAGFSGVDCAYQAPDGTHIALQRASFVLPAGKTTLIVGRSGSGKTTIARLLLGFLKPTAGRVEVLGRDVATWDHEALLETMSYLAQGDYVVEDTVRANLFAHDKDDTELVHVLTRVGLGDVLDKVATKLSIGQQQRVALARLLLDDAAIVLMDEPLSGVDAFTFLELAPDLKRFLEQMDRTFVIISHRLAFVSHADYIVVIDDGSVLEHDWRDALLADRGSKFAQLHEAARRELVG
jgi:ABC-type multidrug transport system fused ATPase/permease subunit